MSEGLGLATAFRTLTRLSVPGKESHPSRSLYWFPLAGLFYGACFWLCSLLPFSPFVRSALELAFTAWMSRGFHYDGLSDTADGFGGGWTRERRLEIMKDSRVGSFGVLAVGVVLLVQFALLSSLQDEPFVLLSTPVWARSSQVLVAVTHDYARKEGTAGDLVRGAKGRHLLVVLACCAMLLCLLRSLPVLVGFLGAMAMGVYVGHVSQRKIGGVTGDVLGAVETLSAAASLLCSLAFLSVQA